MNDYINIHTEKKIGKIDYNKHNVWIKSSVTLNYYVFSLTIGVMCTHEPPTMKSFDTKSIIF